MVLPRIVTKVTPVSVEIAEHVWRRPDTGEVASDVSNYMSFHLTKNGVQTTLCISVKMKRLVYIAPFRPYMQYYMCDGHHRISRIQMEYRVSARYAPHRGLSDFDWSCIVASINDVTIDAVETCYSTRYSTCGLGTIESTQLRTLTGSEFAEVTDCVVRMATPREIDSAE
jgi:hypothetical protein